MDLLHELHLATLSGDALSYYYQIKISLNTIGFWMYGILRRRALAFSNKKSDQMIASTFKFFKLLLTCVLKTFVHLIPVHYIPKSV
jgi:hypothetical protein